MFALNFLCLGTFKCVISLAVVVHCTEIEDFLTRSWETPEKKTGMPSFEKEPDIDKLSITVLFDRKKRVLHSSKLFQQRLISRTALETIVSIKMIKWFQYMPNVEFVPINLKFSSAIISNHHYSLRAYFVFWNFALFFVNIITFKVWHKAPPTRNPAFQRQKAKQA